MPVQRVTTAATSALAHVRIFDGALVRKRDRRGGFVDEIDRLVGKETVGDEAGRELRRRFDRVVVDRHVMMARVALAQAAQDFESSPRCSAPRP